MPFAHAFDPIIFSFGPLALRWYSLVYVAGFLLAYWILRRFAREGRIAGFDEEAAEELIVWLIIGSIVAARLFYAAVYNPLYFLAQPWKVLFVWEGGLSFHGGLIGAVVAGLWFSRRRNLSFFALADLLVLPLSLALVFGRVANFINGELVGRLADPERVPWCVTYPANPAIEGCRHPSQFYEAGKNLVSFLILLPVYTTLSLRGRLREGTLFWLFLLLYGVGRFLTNFYRAPDPTDPLWGGLLLGQWLSLGMALLGLGALFARNPHPDAKKRKEIKEKNGDKEKTIKPIK